MKTLLEIIEAVNNGERPDYEELFYGVLALASLNAAQMQDISSQIDVLNQNLESKRLTALYTEKTLQMSPKQYVGWDNDPVNPDYLRRRAELRSHRPSESD